MERVGISTKVNGWSNTICQNILKGALGMNKRFKYLVTCNLMQKRSRHVYLKCSKLGCERRYCIQVTMGKQHNTLYCRCLRIKNFPSQDEEEMMG